MKDNLLGNFIRNKRDELDMSLREFGKMCGISHTTIDCIEKGYDPRTGKEINITNNTFLKLSKALNIPISQLVELSQNIKENPHVPQDIGPNKQAVLDLIEDLDESEAALLLERIKKIKESRV